MSATNWGRGNGNNRMLARPVSDRLDVIPDLIDARLPDLLDVILDGHSCNT
jgi:hypothetical protein